MFVSHQHKGVCVTCQTRFVDWSTKFEVIWLFSMSVAERELRPFAASIYSRWILHLAMADLIWFPMALIASCCKEDVTTSPSTLQTIHQNQFSSPLIKFNKHLKSAFDQSADLRIHLWPILDRPVVRSQTSNSEVRVRRKLRSLKRSAK